MSRQILPLRRQDTRKMVLPSSPSNVTRRCDFSFSADSCCCRNDAVQFLTQTSRVVVQLPIMVLSEAFRLSLFLVVRGGIGFIERLGAQSTRSLTAFWILTLEPERLENLPAIARNESRDGLSTDAQAACCFRCSASKPPPFFQTIKVMAAILRASVRRAIVGFIPRATKAA